VEDVRAQLAKNPSEPILKRYWARRSRVQSRQQDRSRPGDQGTVPVPLLQFVYLCSWFLYGFPARRTSPLICVSIMSGRRQVCADFRLCLVSYEPFSSLCVDAIMWLYLYYKDCTVLYITDYYIFATSDTVLFVEQHF
jgi:hypothetical protein